ncbi:hypothetical protein KG007_08615 [Alistipes sp. kh20]|uniref:hypothetical protein n=1 Tax=Alistipes montrealensis TaxID=2834113 RepID=UPI001BD133B1|nr:hypothetical protein [Alistipes montrealensis]MBS4766269.1 hypothetical protein [Alistipes montrealensis]
MKNILLRMSLIIWTALLISCSEDRTEIPDKKKKKDRDNISLTIEDAHACFSQTLLGLKAQTRISTHSIESSAQSFEPGNYTPDWSKAIISANDSIESVDVPILAEYLYTVTIYDKLRDSVKHTKLYNTAIAQKLVTVRNKKDSVTGCYIMTIIPAKISASSDYNKVNDSFFNGGVNSSFSGLIHYASIKDNSTVRVDYYEQGDKRLAASCYDTETTETDKITFISSILSGAEFYQLNSTPIEEVVIPGWRPHKPDIVLPWHPTYPDPNPGGGGGTTGGSLVGGGGTGSGSENEDDYNDDIKHHTDYKIQFSVSATTIEVLDKMYLSATVEPIKTIEQSVPSNIYYDWQIAYNNDWKSILGDGSNWVRFAPPLPGKFRFRVIVTIDYTDKYVSDPIEVDVIFPSFDDIIGANAQLIDELWTKSKNACNPRTFREYGTVIYLDTRTEEKGLYDYELFTGPEAPSDGTQGAHVQVKYSIYTNPDPRNGMRIPVVAIHTHPPLVYVNSAIYRTPGPSPADIQEGDVSEISQMVYDYTSGQGGTPIDAPAKLYAYGKHYNGRPVMPKY